MEESYVGRNGLLVWKHDLGVGKTSKRKNNPTKQTGVQDQAWGWRKERKIQGKVSGKWIYPKEGIDFTEIFSPVVEMSSIIIILGIVATLDLECE